MQLTKLSGLQYINRGLQSPHRNKYLMISILSMVNVSFPVRAALAADFALPEDSRHIRHTVYSHVSKCITAVPEGSTYLLVSTLCEVENRLELR